MHQDSSPHPEEPPRTQPPEPGGVAPHGSQQNSQPHRFWQNWTSLEWTQVLFDALLFAATTAYAIFALQQGCALNATLEETKQLVKAAHIQANAAVETAKAAQDANTLTRAAQKQATDLVADADRPWVGVHGITVVDYEPEKKMGARLAILNSGKTPALNVRTEISIRTIEGIPSQPPTQTWPMSYQGQAVLFPNQPILMTIALSVPLSSDRFNQLASGTSSLIIWGTMTYTDRFTRSHTSTLCALFNPTLDPTNIVFCATGNTAD